MGSFLTNVQVHLPGEDRAAARTRVVEALHTLLAEEGYTQCVGAEEPDREVVVVADNESPWLVVYDQAAEDQSGKHVDLSRTLSRAMSARVISILIHDSNVLEMKLFANGQEEDTYCNRPAYFEGGKRRPSGREDAWSAVLRAGSTVRELKKRWRKRSLFAEEILHEVAPVLGMSTALSSVGYNYLEELELPEDREVRVRVRSAERKTQAQTSRDRPETSLDRPRLVRGLPPTLSRDAALMLLSPINVNQPGETLFGAPVGHPFVVAIHVHNAGGGGTGVEVTISGTVLQERLVEIERVELFTHLAGVEQAVMTRTGRRGSEFQASFPSLVVHAGPQDPLAVFSGARSIQQVVDRHKHVVTARVHCRATGHLTAPQPLEVMVFPMGGGGSGCIQRVLVGERSL